MTDLADTTEELIRNVTVVMNDQVAGCSSTPPLPPTPSPSPLPCSNVEFAISSIAHIFLKHRVRDGWAEFQ